MINPQQQPGNTARQRRSMTRQTWSLQQAERSRVDDPQPTEPLIWELMAVQVVHDDYLECKYYDADGVYGHAINVAKDPDLRHSYYDGLTVDGLSYAYTGAQARTVTKVSDSSEQDQVVIPKYHVPADGTGSFIGSIIRAVPVPSTVRNDGDSADVSCPMSELTNRAWANVEDS